MLAGNVLVVQDGRTMDRQLVTMLDDMGHGVRLLSSAEQGLEVFGKRSFDVVLSDVHLPGMDGIEMVRRMQDIDPLVSPIIMTSRGNQDTAVRAVECGVRFFLSKPIDRETLREKLQDVLGARQREAERQAQFADLLRMRSELQKTVVAQHRRLALTEGYLDDLLDAAPFAIVSADHDGHVLTLNSTAQQLYGRTEAQALGHDVADLFGAALEARESRCEHTRRDGTPFPVFVRQRQILDDSQKHIAQLYVIEDLSESETLREQLLYAERLSVLGQLAPRIAHEFKTPLQLISGFMELALTHLDNEHWEDSKECVRSVRPAIEQLGALVQQISNLGKPEKSEVAALNLGVQVERVLHPIQQLGVLKHCRVETDFADPLPQVQGDPMQIEQVFRNLIINAVHAMEGCSQRTLRVELAPSTNGEEVHCCVSDTGTGIPPQELERVFQPFYTTKPHGKGTGLGLPIVKSVLDRHGATLRVESQPGEGTRFLISFPAVGAEAAVKAV